MSKRRLQGTTKLAWDASMEKINSDNDTRMVKNADTKNGSNNSHLFSDRNDREYLLKPHSETVDCSDPKTVSKKHLQGTTILALDASMEILNSDDETRMVENVGTKYGSNNSHFFRDRIDREYLLKPHSKTVDCSDPRTIVNRLTSEKMAMDEKSIVPCASDAFIRVETKDGLSTERIPFKQFLQKLGLGGSLRDFEANLSRFVIRNKQQKINISTTDTSQPLDTVGDNRRQALSKPIEKTRGRPSKKRNLTVPHKSKDKTMQESMNKETHALYEMNAISADNSKAPDEIASFPILPQQRLRRSCRIPARSKRFDDDYVDSSTFGKVSAAQWNAQLMTLALAAERHETTPNACKNNAHMMSNAHHVKHDEGGSSSSELSSSYNNREIKHKENLSVLSFEHDQDTVSAVTVLGLRGPKTIKKYDSVIPVVQRSLLEALSQSVIKSKDGLAKDILASIDTDGSTAFYTLMEPKMLPSGNGLSVHKTKTGVHYRNAVVDGKIKTDNTASICKETCTQDRLFSCDLCDAVYTMSSSWLQHNKYHHQRDINDLDVSKQNLSHEKGKFICLDCGHCFPYQFMLDVHVKRRRHNESKSYRCNLCRQSFCSHREREKHWIISHPARNCGICGKEFTNIVMLRRHISDSCHSAGFRHRLTNSTVKSNTSLVLGVPKEVKEQVPEITSSKEESSSLTVKVTCEKETNNLLHEAEKVTTHAMEEGLSQYEVNYEGDVFCEMCSLEFSKPCDLWNHHLKTGHLTDHVKEHLKKRFEKNETSLLNLSGLEHLSIGNKSKFYTILQPKSEKVYHQLRVSFSDKIFTFNSHQLQKTKHLDFSESKLEGNIFAMKKQLFVFECPQCNKVYKSAPEYRQHSSLIHGECFETVRLLGAFQCNYCSDTFPCQFMLNKHEKKHVGKRSLPCTLCGLTFHKIQDRRDHWKTVHPGIGCPNCGKMYASIKFLQKHISLNCQDHFPPSQSFLEFRKQQHNDFEMEKTDKRVEKKIIRCHLCSKISSSVNGWRRHMSKCHEEEGFSKLSNFCFICNELVYGYKALEKHVLQVHAEDSGVPVDEENRMIEEALKKSEIGIIAYHRAGREIGEIYQDEAGNYHCPSCSKIHTDLSALKTHIKTHVNMGLKCSICNKEFKNHVLLKQHVQRHRKKCVYSCDTCNKNFMTLQKLSKHHKVHHRDQTFTCELCGMSFTQNDYLQKHLRCHSNKRPHVCTVCGKAFRTKPELRVHLHIHTKETPFKCHFCGRGFSQKGNYRIHLAQHTGEKPYQCDQCNLSFALYCHLKRHRLTHNQKINFRCIWCGKECTQRKHMQMHVQRVHKEDFFAYEEHMRLETPVPIAPSQAKMYNRKMCQPNKVRGAYQTKAQKCNSTTEEILEGIDEGVQPVGVSGATSSSHMVVESLMQPLEAVTSVLPAVLTSEEVTVPYGQDGFEIMVGNDHQNYIKSTHESTGSQLLPQHDQATDSKLEIVMGDNNEISIIIKDSSTLQNILR